MAFESTCDMVVFLQVSCGYLLGTVILFFMKNTNRCFNKKISDICLTIRIVVIKSYLVTHIFIKSEEGRIDLYNG